MRNKGRNLKGFIAGLLLSTLVFILQADDWPQFRGIHRDGISREKGLLQHWPHSGPQLLWSSRENIGLGYASVSLAEGKIFTTGLLNGEGVLFAFTLKGDLLWKTVYGPEWTGAWRGSRSTPTVVKGRIYLFSGVGRLAELMAMGVFAIHSSRELKENLVFTPVIPCT